MGYFQQFDEPNGNNHQFLYKCSEHLIFETYPTGFLFSRVNTGKYCLGKILFHYGDEGDKFYFILSGEVFIFLPKSSEEILEEYKLHQLPSYKFREFRAETDADKANKLLLMNNDRKIMYLKKGVVSFKKIANVGPGKYFGEVALILEKPRTATVVASMKLDVITLTKKNYERIFKGAIETSNEKINFFLKKFPNVSHNQMTYFAFNFQEKFYRFKETLYKENDPPNGFYFIISGEVHALKKWRLLAPNKRKKERILHIYTLTGGEFFGDYDLIISNPKRYLNCVIGSMEGAHLYFMSADAFNNNKNFFPEIIGFLEKEGDLRRKYAREREIQCKKVQNFILNNKTNQKDPIKEFKKNEQTPKNYLFLKKPFLSPRETKKSTDELMKKKDLNYTLTTYFQEKYENVMKTKNLEQDRTKFIKLKEIINNFDLKKIDSEEIRKIKYHQEKIIPRTKSNSPTNICADDLLKQKFLQTFTVLKKNLGDYQDEENLRKIFDMPKRASSSEIKKRNNNIIHPFIFQKKYEGNFDKMIKKAMQAEDTQSPKNFNEGWLSNYLSRVITHYRNRNVYYLDDQNILNLPEIYIEKMKN